MARHPQQQLLLLAFAAFAALAAAAQLPAVRAPVEKRALVSRLLRSADSHKTRSLRDVLAEHPRGAEEAADGGAAAGPRDHGLGEDPAQQKAAFRTVSQLFAWAIQHSSQNASLRLTTTTPVLSAAGAPPAPRQLPGRASTRTPDAPREALPPPVREATETEYDLLTRSLGALGARAPARQARALRVVEELCHSIDNGRDLQAAGGVPPLVAALESTHASVRANAAWALATCAQNNPAVQNASLEAAAVPRLSFLAARDRSRVVRAKALFALNALLELEEARIAFERLPLAIHAVRNALFEGEDIRATRRALNLTELLVTRNLDSWKTWLEAWDVPSMVERILRVHPDADVRESAARTLAALDGRTVP